MAAIHVIVDTKRRPTECRIGGGAVKGIHHVSLDVGDRPLDVAKTVPKLMRLILKAMNGSD